LLEANEIYSKIYGSDDNHHASVLRRQANNLIAEGKVDAAGPKLEEAMGIFERKKTWGKLGPTYRELAEFYTKAGKSKEADAYKQKAEKTELEHPKAGDSRIE
jgi:tetratricopeptide (TPR) repeat protein